MKAIILAGGKGERLWPLSRERHSKQFISFFGQKTLLQETYERTLVMFAPQDVITVTNQDYFYYVSHIAAKVSPHLADSIIAEPARKNTAPAIALACQYAKEKFDISDEEIIFVFPADHVIKPIEEFQKMVRTGIEAAQSGYLTVFGTYPNKPETGYGYIKAGKPVKSFHKVDCFTEKPDLKTAKKYLRSGKYFWNAGIFAFNLGVFCKELKEYNQPIWDIVSQGFQKAIKNFAKMPSISIDYAIMEKTQRSAVVKTNIIWADLGSWDSFYDVSQKDNDNNVLVGDVRVINTKDSLVYSNSKLTTVLGVKDLLIINTDDALLVCKKNDSQDVKKILSILQSEKKEEALEPREVYRNWGKYIVSERGMGYKIKKVFVDPGESLSLQLHHKRSEHWVVVKGKAQITINKKVFVLKKGESAFVPPKTLHRIENPFKEIVEIVEVQNGVCEEEDIVRFQDKYGRKTIKKKK